MTRDHDALAPRFSHVAVTVPRDLLAEPKRGQLLDFYGEVFGWKENESFAIEGERIFLRAPSDRQYLTIRASDAPMQTSGYEHLGLWVDSAEQLDALYDRARARGANDPAVELSEVRVLYGGRLRTFRLRYVLPLTLEIQYVADGGSA